MACALVNHTPCPQIGMLCIDFAVSLRETIKSFDIQSYIPASYVKFLKGAGAEIVPIWIGRERDYYEKLLGKLNGVLIPGGAVFFNSKPNSKLSNKCVESSKYIFEIATKLNENGIYFPIWGTCLGFQLMLYHAAIGENSEQVRCDCKQMDCSLPICFEKDFSASKLFENLDESLKTTMETEPFGYHYHRYGVTRQALSHFKLDQDWCILATNKDENGLEFVTFIEHKRFPFYGTQVHLERVSYEILKGGIVDNCNHSEHCKKAAEYFAKFFVAECAKCSQKFETSEDCLCHSINNFPVTETNGTHWLECYLFDEAPSYATI